MKKPTISPVERAVIVDKWRKKSVDAYIHTLVGNDSKKLVTLAGTMFYVALGAAMADGLDASDSDVRILRGAVNAMADQAGNEAIPFIRRKAIESGLMAVSRIVERCEHKSLVKAACDLELKLRSGHVMHLDFLELVA